MSFVTPLAPVRKRPRPPSPPRLPPFTCVPSDYQRFRDESNWAPKTAVTMLETDDMGWGLYAAQDIPAGKIVTEYTGERRLLRDARYRAGGEWPKTHCMKVFGSFDFCIDGWPLRSMLPGGLDVRKAGAFLNSSEDENLARKWSGPPECRLFFETTRLVHLGEQLVFFYRDF